MARARTLEEAKEDWVLYQIRQYPHTLAEMWNIAWDGNSLLATNACQAWLLAEKDYLWEMERRLHKAQRESRRRYIKTLEWLLAEARWQTEISQDVRATEEDE